VEGNGKGTNKMKKRKKKEKTKMIRRKERRYINIIELL